MVEDGSIKKLGWPDSRAPSSSLERKGISGRDISTQEQ
jgi:hypothetical protein